MDRTFCPTALLKTRSEPCAEAKAQRDARGPEAFEAFLVSLATEHESWLRPDDPNHPILELLDEHRSKAKLGFDP